MQGIGFWAKNNPFNFVTYYSSGPNNMTNPSSIIVYSTKADPGVGDILYSDINLTTPVVDGYYWLKFPVENTFKRKGITSGTGTIGIVGSFAYTMLTSPTTPLVSQTSNGSGGSSGQVTLFLIEDEYDIDCALRFTQTGSNTAGVAYKTTVRYDNAAGNVIADVNRTNDFTTFDSITFNVDLTKSRIFTVSVPLDSLGAGTSGNTVRFNIDLIPI